MNVIFFKDISKIISHFLIELFVPTTSLRKNLKYKNNIYIYPSK